MNTERERRDVASPKTSLSERNLYFHLLQDVNTFLMIYTTLASCSGVTVVLPGRQVVANRSSIAMEMG